MKRGKCLIIFISSVHGNLSQLWLSEGKSFIRAGGTARLIKRLPRKQEDERKFSTQTGIVAGACNPGAGEVGSR